MVSMVLPVLLMLLLLVPQCGAAGLPGGARRVRRGWTMPGTLWCGAGDSAGNFSELGVFQGPDVCCREHDQCEAQIPGLGYGYGMRNFRLHTISHCDCDKRFRECLMDQNDTISNFVGITYFTYLEIPCFILEESEECTEWEWWGGCKTYGPMPLARLVQQNQYHGSSAFSDPVTPPPHTGRHMGKGKKHKQRKLKHLKQKTVEAQKRHPDHSTVQASTFPLVSEVNQVPINSSYGSITKGSVSSLPTRRVTTTLDLLKMSVAPIGELPNTQKTSKGEPDHSDAATATDTGGHRHTTTLSNLASSQSCSCYRRLDQCPYRIMPNEVKYQLRNRDSRTLFHCNCTRQLARFLRKTHGPNEVEGEVLSDYVSSACFVLQTPPGCREGEEGEPNCIDVGKAVLASARHLTNRLARKRLAPSFKVKRQERTPPDRPLLLFEKCMRLAQDPHRARPH